MQAGKLEPEGFFKSDIAVLGTCQQLRLGVTIKTDPRERNSSKSSFSSLPTIEHRMPISVILKSSVPGCRAPQGRGFSTLSKSKKGREK
jgi:hypothetical protein